jgi:hypothetical protein
MVSDINLKEVEFALLLILALYSEFLHLKINPGFLLILLLKLKLWLKI